VPDSMHYTLVVTTCHVEVGDVSTWTRCYNGTVPGPTLRVQPGQELMITVVNTLSPDQNMHTEIVNETGFGEYVNLTQLQEPYNFTAEGTGSLFGLPNTTNLHLHGLVISAASPADDVLMAIKPGSAFNYVYRGPPHHMGGTMWYHPHHHHSTAGQANGGMFAGLLVEDAPASLPPVFMEAEERLMLVNTLDVRFQRAVARMSMDNLWQTTSNATVTLVNGTLEPRSAMRSGVWYRFRFVYASMFNSLRMALRSESATCQMALLAKDGIYLNEAPRVVSCIWLASGNRADVVVSCSCQGAPECSATFRSEWGPRDEHEFRVADAHWDGNPVTRTWSGDVFHLDIEGDSGSIAPALPVFRPKMPCYLADLNSLSSEQLSPGNRVNVDLFWTQTMSNDLEGGRTDAFDHDVEYNEIIKGQFGMMFNGTRNRMMSDEQAAIGTLP